MSSGKCCLLLEAQLNIFRTGVKGGTSEPRSQLSRWVGVCSLGMNRSGSVRGPVPVFPPRIWCIASTSQPRSREQEAAFPVLFWFQTLSSSPGLRETQRSTGRLRGAWATALPMAPMRCGSGFPRAPPTVFIPARIVRQRSSPVEASAGPLLLLTVLFLYQLRAG